MFIHFALNADLLNLDCWQSVLLFLL